MADHSDFLELAREMLAEEGREVTFAKLSKGPADPDRPNRGAGTPTPTDPVTTLAVFLPDGSGFGKLIEDNDLFKSAEQILLVAPPVTGENLDDYHILVDGDDIEVGPRWKIDVTKTLQPATLAVLHVMGVSR